ncbi:MAG: hypothetical protein AAB116_01715, partial [Candidatus Poribacteria bacterium]
ETENKTSILVPPSNGRTDLVPPSNGRTEEKSETKEQTSESQKPADASKVASSTKAADSALVPPSNGRTDKPEPTNEVIPDQNINDQLNADQFIDPERQRAVVEDMMQEDRGNWIESEKNELKRKMEQQKNDKSAEKKGILKRSLESFTFSTDFGYDINDYLRQLKPDMGFFDILKLEPESKYRNRSTQGRRLSVRSNVDPFTWASLGTNMSFTNRFSKSMGTAYNSDSSSVGGDVKLSKNTLSTMLKYDMTIQNSDNISGNISNSTSHNPSVTFRNNWKSGVGSSFGFRTTFRTSERSDVTTKSLIITPNLNIDYNLHLEGNLGIPFTGKSIKMDHNFDMSNTISAMVRREKLGVNRDEKSEQYGTSLDMSYDLRERIRASIRFSVDYNHDRVQADSDYITLSGSVMIRGEFR